MDVDTALTRLTAMFGGVQRLGVAFSGGTASATLLTLAVRASGAERVVAVIGVCATWSPAERAATRATAEALGVRLVEITAGTEGDPLFLSPGPQRCFHCLQEFSTRLATEVATAEGLDAIAYADDADDAIRLGRTGVRAGHRPRILRPLAAAGWGHDDVRVLAEALQLPVRPLACPSAPAAPTTAALSPMAQLQADRALRILESLGFPAGSVTPDGVTARVALPHDDLPRAVSDGVRETLVEALRTAGFRHVTLDLAVGRALTGELPVLRAELA